MIVVDTYCPDRALAALDRVEHAATYEQARADLIAAGAWCAAEARARHRSIDGAHLRACAIQCRIERRRCSPSERLEHCRTVARVVATTIRRLSIMRR